MTATSNITGKALFVAEAQIHAQRLDPKGEWSDASLDELRDDMIEITKSEVLQDVRTGRVPANVASFSALHDHVDANGYGGAFQWASVPSDHEGDEEYLNTHCEFWNKVQNAVDAWIKGGGIHAASVSGS